MSHRLPAIVLSALLSCSVLSPAHAQPAWTQNNPYAPWLMQAAATESIERPVDEFALIAAPFDDREAPAPDNTQDQTQDQTQDDHSDAPAMQAAHTHQRNALPLLTPAHTKKIMQQIAAQERARNASLIEQAYSSRIIDQLSQFGYEIFEQQQEQISPLLQLLEKKPAREGLPGGAAQDDFVLSSGDRLMVTIRGQKNEQKNYIIDNQGFLIVDDITPIPAAGLSLKQVREILEAESALRPNTEYFVSLDAVRQIDILVVGHVRKPGRQTLSVFHTVLDALIEAGGIDKTGSLRQVKLVRNGRSTYIDLYGLLVHASTNMDMQLRDGDRLIIPPIGPTMAIAGNVKRPGIYELLPDMRGVHTKGDRSQKLSVEEALDLAGGYLTPGATRLIKLELTAEGQEKSQQVGKNAYAPIFGDGTILMVSAAQQARTGTVEMLGETRQPGMHDLEQNKSLSALIPSEKALGKNIYPLIGVIERQNQDTMSVQLIDFSPLLVAKGTFDRKLEDGDAVHLFSRAEIQELQHGPIKSQIIEVGATTEQKEPITPAMKSFLEERSVYVRGAVRNPGPWPVSEGASLEAVISAAGGTTLEANQNDIEVSSLHQPGANGIRQRLMINANETELASVVIGPGDNVRVNQKFKRVADNSILLMGEVKNPGRYDLAAGETLHDVLIRAGGLTDDAYPEGAIFSRESERKAEEARFRAAARELERALAESMNKKDPPDTTQIAMARDLATELKSVEAVGRITVEADPGKLSVDPELNILMERGDRIFIPKRPLTVRVNGEVLSPANLQFRKTKKPRDYIMEAGGFTYNADDDRAFVLYPNGSAQPLQVSNWSHGTSQIPPGSTIVVPRDPKPFDFIQSAKDISQILSNLAVTGIFLNDIKDD